ncbi:MBL fold metallo-hydrolase RNA specificity domain-containing protein [Marinomonas posidonica]|uniref:RNA-metabolising metallo-beta-lactamase n=1 Tax=Marinomonas posidonica (strain CECT 7376 / NCIMB 14433 / IVIA-Po-181) TaxID=491952 RepID=F6CZ77_MARPP|nr:MBL fold metallo-hydrolase [Marinomonas posidonica]AEF53533.1 RNA-metabolising metallo-beta-lactamase [Marinomonas posidonica IVIA-Po-181]
MTGSCHEPFVDDQQSILIDRVLFQGTETFNIEASADHLEIDFDLSAVQALVITHVHVDHVGRIPYLLAAGFTGPIYCSKPSATLLPLVIEDALKVGVTRNKSIINACLDRIHEQIVPLDYQEWVKIPMQTETKVQLRLSRAGHILGSAYASFRVSNEAIKLQNKPYHDVVFSGDLGAPHSPLLPAPKSPHKADQLVIESTYGDRNHEDRSSRIDRLQHSLERALSDSGTVLIPAFSIGRTQELLYELESIIHKNRQKPISHTDSGVQLDWQDLDIIIDSPLANRFTQVYQSLAPYWDEEAQSRIAEGRHPLDFEQVTTIDDHETHLQTVDYLKRQSRPAIVIAASGMCASGRIVNYIKALIGDERNDIVLVGYQAAGTPGREILTYHNKEDGYVMLDGERFAIKTQVQQISGYSAHAGQEDLLNFIRRMRSQPKRIHIVHGDDHTKQTLKTCIRKEFKGVEVIIP